MNTIILYSSATISQLNNCLHLTWTQSVITASRTSQDAQGQDRRGQAAQKLSKTSLSIKDLEHRTSEGGILKGHYKGLKFPIASRLIASDCPITNNLMFSLNHIPKLGSVLVVDLLTHPLPNC